MIDVVWSIEDDKCLKWWFHNDGASQLRRDNEAYRDYTIRAVEAYTQSVEYARTLSRTGRMMRNLHLDDEGI
jgi:hypothetical protein